jgi:hypothetical protein
MEIGQESSYLILGEPAGEGGHHSLPLKDNVGDFAVVGGRATGELAAAEETVQVRRDLLEREVVVAMAMGASAFVEVLAFGLLRGEWRLGMATGEGEDRDKE